MFEVTCPLCKLRVSDTAMALSRAKIVECYIVHKQCLEDYKLRRGVDWTGWEKMKESA